MIYVYAVINLTKHPLPAQTGLEGAPLRLIEHEDIAAVVSAFGAASATASGDNLWLHEDVLEALMVEHTVLPLRFGTLARDESDVREALDRGYREFARDIARLCGHVEIGLRLQELPLLQPDDGAVADGFCNAAHADAPSVRGDGTQYLSQRLAEREDARRRTRRLLERTAPVLDALKPHAAEHLVESESRTSGRLNAAFLVRTNEVAAFLHAVQRAAAADTSLALLCSGPWPTYSFVTGDLASCDEMERHHG